jgi:hypothetical protein
MPLLKPNSIVNTSSDGLAPLLVLGRGWWCGVCVLGSIAVNYHSVLPRQGVVPGDQRHIFEQSDL